MTNSAPKYGGDLATDLDYQGPMSHVDALSGASKEIELPELDALYQLRNLVEVRAIADLPIGQCRAQLGACFNRAEQRENQLAASLTRERDKDEEIARLKARVEQRDRQIGAYNSGGFADSDAMAEKYLDLRQRADDLQQRAEKAVEILEKATITSSIKNVAKAIERAIALLTAPKENSK